MHLEAEVNVKAHCTENNTELVAALNRFKMNELGVLVYKFGALTILIDQNPDLVGKIRANTSTGITIYTLEDKVVPYTKMFIFGCVRIQLDCAPHQFIENMMHFQQALPLYYNGRICSGTVIPYPHEQPHNWGRHNPHQAMFDNQGPGRDAISDTLKASGREMDNDAFSLAVENIHASYQTFLAEGISLEEHIKQYFDHLDK